MPFSRYIASFFGLVIFLILTFILLVYAGLFGPVPETNQLRNIRHDEASEVYSSNGQLLGNYFVQNRTHVSLKEVPEEFRNALLAIEDIRFYDHDGVDFRALFRVLIKSVILGQDSGGGSTITQQLAKNLYPRSGSGRFHLAADKLREIIIARRLEVLYNKDEILELYINTVSFGEETFGVEMASRRFFNTTPGDLEIQQASTLAGVLRATTRYNPRLYPDRSTERRNVVIRQMDKYGMITSGEADSLVQLPLGLNYNRITENDGMAPHFREHLRMELQDVLENEAALDGKEYNLYRDGLRIETTIDSRLQAAAEKATSKHMAALQSAFDQQLLAEPVFTENDPSILNVWVQSGRYQKLKEAGKSEDEIEEIFHKPVPMHLFTWEGGKEVEASPRDSIAHYLSFLNSGFFAMEPEHGEVKAWVGGINHQYFQYDHVKAQRQPGSAFKPVVYASALSTGMKPCSYHRNQLNRYVNYKDWTPQNTQEEYGGYYSMQGALKHSVNTVSVDILMNTGIEHAQLTAARMGIQSRIPNRPSIALGAAEVNLFELTSAYAAFANRGIPTLPYYLKAIYNRDGELIYEFKNPNSAAYRDQAMSEDVASAMIHMLSDAVNEGTGSSLRTRFGIDHALAGKTGTTQNYTDGWFIGITPDLVFGSWVGGWSPRVRFSQGLGYASQTALPIAGYFLQNAAADDELKKIPDRFYPHQLESSYSFDCSDWQDDRFKDKVKEFFTGKGADDPRTVDEEKEKTSIFGRIKKLFGGNK
ncbi:MAG: transglycosylase domain-containing protein [Balneolaceae bacterium]